MMPPGKIDRPTERLAEMAALDGLPRELRFLLKFGPYCANPIDVATHLRSCRSLQRCIAMIWMVWHGTPNAHAREWAKWNPLPYPHHAAHATLMLTKPHDTLPFSRNGLLAKRRVARLRAPPPMPVRERERPPLPGVILL